MLSKRFLFVISLAMLLSSSYAKKVKNPNIILVMTDDQGWFDAGFNGNEIIKTPNLDRLAEDGIILNRFYSASAVCSPTRASLITGRNPYRTDVPTANSGSMREGEITIAELLKEQGYATGHFGKWHLGILTKTQKDANRGGREKFFDEYSIPTQHGYDSFFCTESKVPTYDPMNYPSAFKSYESKKYGWDAIEDDSALVYGTAYWKGEGILATENLEGDEARVIMDRVIPFIDDAQDQKKPFFTTVWFHTPHLPVVADKEHRDLYKELSEKERIYYGTISAMDDQMGRLWQHLVDEGIEDNTMIWFCSDNGPERNTPGSAGIYRERKRSLYEGGLRVPAFVVWKDKLKGGIQTDFPMVTSDYLPTIVDLLDLDYPDDRPIDGVSLKGVILDGETERKEAIGFRFSTKISWVTDQYKLITVDNGKTYELYDLLEDPSEKQDIITQYPQVAEMMKAELDQWLISIEHSRVGGDY